MKNSAFLTAITIVALLTTSGCNEHAPLRENANAQNTALTQSKYQELSPAEGTFIGKMWMRADETSTNYDVPFDCVLQIERFIEAQQAQQPTETVGVPKLSADLSFPILENLSPEKFPDFAILINPMGRLLKVIVDYGNYDPSTREITLPYKISRYPQSNFGTLTGKLKGSHYVGRWYSKPLGEVGRFDLVK